MPTEREKMLAGELYDAMDAELVAARTRARELCKQLNASPEADEAGRRAILRDLLGVGGDTVSVQPPFYCDYRTNITLGERVFFNFDCVVLDVCRRRARSSRRADRRPGGDRGRQRDDARRAGRRPRRRESLSGGPADRALSHSHLRRT
jgi:Maltose acetyltransferase